MTSSHDSDEVVDIATQVADGLAVDWPSARDQAVEDSRSAVDQLRAIAEIARVHRVFQSASAPVAAAAPPPRPQAPSGGVAWGPLLVFEKLGSGAFGEVFRAWDASLQREVALKLLRSREAGESAVEEGQRLARVSHPNVMAVYGAQRVGAQVGVWGELLRGQTLADLIAAQGPLGADETLIAGEALARALAAVHRTGMLHRDVKAQNVFRERGGRLVLMDLGLGRELNAAAAPGEMAGTPLYLAPELFEGGNASVQSDLFSLGVLLFFLVTGEFPVNGASLDEVTRAHREGRRARLQDLRPELPRQFVRVVERAIDPDPARRYASAGAMQTALARAVHGDDPRPDGGRRRVGPAALAAACAAAALIAGAAAWVVLRPRPAARPLPARFSIVPSPAQSLDIQENDRNIAISPDGSFLVYRSGGTSTGGPLMLRPRERLEAQPLPGITNGRGPFFSPDGRSVGFFDRQELKRIALTGEPAVPICRFEGYPRGASWGDDNTIVFATNDTASGLWRVAAGGGTPVPVTTPDHARQEADHLLPSVLPGRRGVLFTIVKDDPDKTMEIAVLDAATGKYRTLIPKASQPEYVPAPPGQPGPGHLLYAAGGRLRVVGFDLDGLQLSGESEPVVEHLQMGDNGEANYAAAGTGTLAYLAGEQEPSRTLVWVDRKGKEDRIAEAPEYTYNAPRISPDGRRVVLEVRAQEQDLYLWDLVLKRLTRITFGRALERSPLWSRDGRRVVFASDRDRADQFRVYAQNADGTGSAEQIAAAVNAHPESMDAAGSVICDQFMSHARIVRLTPGAQVEEAVFDIPVDHLAGRISPNGRYIAYQSNESGRHEVYVQPYPRPDGGRWQISTGGGSDPMWARSGTELFFLDGASLMTAVPVVTNAAFSSGESRKLFDARTYASEGGRAYDVSPDDSRFLLIKPSRPAESSLAAPAILVVLNWLEDVRPTPGRARR